MKKLIINKILIANRGEIANRIIKTARKMGIGVVLPITGNEKNGEPAMGADQKLLFDSDLLSDTYLNPERLISLALKAGADAIHPGYGFLSESTDFARKVEQAGLIWIGPSPESIAVMGNKLEARRIAQKSGIPVTKGITGTASEILEQKEMLTYPLLIKSAAGGGGKGMKLVQSSGTLKQMLEEAARESLNYFGDASVYAEQYLESPRHVEVQVLGDQHNHLVHLFERECSIQRRHQKIIEEAPSPFVDPPLREKLTRHALRLCRAIGYFSAGTVEFLVDQAGHHYFLEMNTRIQVEHPVTEAITGIDLVEQQIRVAMGLPLEFSQQEITMNGHAIEARVYAEDALSDFSPSPGPIRLVRWPREPVARTDTFFNAPTEIVSHFDPLLAKIITHDSCRSMAIDKMLKALAQTTLLGTTTNLPFLNSVFKTEEFKRGDIHTHFIDRHKTTLQLSLQPNGQEKTRRLLAAYVVWLTLYRNDKAKNVWNRLGHKRWDGNTRVWFNQKPWSIRMKATGPEGDIHWSLNNMPQPKLSHALISEHNLSFYSSGHFNQLAWHYAFPEGLLLSVDGYSYTLRPGFLPGDIPEKKSGNNAWSQKLSAPIPGRIVKINLRAGDFASRGDTIMILEAMKMENHLIAETSGMIKEISVLSGEQVKAGQILATFENQNHPILLNE